MAVCMTKIETSALRPQALTGDVYSRQRFPAGIVPTGIVRGAAVGRIVVLNYMLSLEPNNKDTSTILSRMVPFAPSSPNT